MTAVAMFIPPPIAPGEPSTVEVLAAIVGPKAARRLLQAFGDSLYEIARAHDPELAAAGVPARRIPLFRAAVLLGRRSLSPLQRGRFMPGPDEVWAYYRGRIAAEPVEVFHMLALDARNRVMQDVRAARGSLTGVEVNPRDLFRELIRMGAAGVIFAHNQPERRSDSIGAGSPVDDAFT